MFFRRKIHRQLTFDDRLEQLKLLGFSVTGAGPGKATVSKFGCAALLEDMGLEHPVVNKAGIMVGDEIGEMMHGGYQMFFVTKSGKKLPALAEHLKALHNFEEDLREGLGLASLYNVSLGTRADQHMYDRVEDRDQGRHKPAWQ
jgi:hypothetical protein